MHIDTDLTQTGLLATQVLQRTGLTGLTQRVLERIHKPPENEDLALQALRENALEKLRSVELTVRQALECLEPDFSLKSIERVDSTWQRHWEEGASKVGVDDEERRKWWARLLAGELEQPGTYSLRTLSVMNTLSAKDAELFTRTCQYVWLAANHKHGEVPHIILPEEKSVLWRPRYDEMRRLDSAGLAMCEWTGGYLGPDGDQQARGRLRLRTQVFFVDMPSGSKGLRYGQLVLTDVGREMYFLTDKTAPESYLNEIVEEWRREGYSVTGG